MLSEMFLEEVQKCWERKKQVTCSCNESLKW